MIAVDDKVETMGKEGGGARRFENGWPFRLFVYFTGAKILVSRSC